MCLYPWLRRNYLIKLFPMLLQTPVFLLLSGKTWSIATLNSFSNADVDRKFGYDSMKIEHQAHGSKTSDPVINTEMDEKLFLIPGNSLASQGVKNETEISLFKRSDYDEYKDGPEHGQTQWWSCKKTEFDFWFMKIGFFDLSSGIREMFSLILTDNEFFSRSYQIIRK